MTRSEYEAAFQSFRRCLQAEGLDLSDVTTDPSTGVHLYGVPRGGVPGPDPLGSPDEPNLSTVAGRCYDQEFSFVELVFHIGDPAIVAKRDAEAHVWFDRDIRPCLESHDVDIPDPLPATSGEEYSALLQRFDQLVASGECPRTAAT